MRGASFRARSYPQLRVTRTADGVRIERSGIGTLCRSTSSASARSASKSTFPRGSHVEIARCAGRRRQRRHRRRERRIAGRARDARRSCSGTRRRAQRRRLSSSRRNVRGDRLAHGVDGRASLAAATSRSESLDAQTHDGRIEADGSDITGDGPHATLHTDDGSIRIRPGAERRPHHRRLDRRRQASSSTGSYTRATTIRRSARSVSAPASGKNDGRHVRRIDSHLYQRSNPTVMDYSDLIPHRRDLLHLRCAGGRVDHLARPRTPGAHGDAAARHRAAAEPARHAQRDEVRLDAGRDAAGRARRISTYVPRPTSTRSSSCAGACRSRSSASRC